MSYKIVNYGKKAKRRSYSKIKRDYDLPNLISIQVESFNWFVEEGLKELFEDISPITNHNENLKLYFGDYFFEEPKYDILESKKRDINYAKPLKVYVKLENTTNGEVIEKPLFMGDIPFMTPQGTFVINGAERVVVSQIVRSSGVYFTKEIDKKTGMTIYLSQAIPTRGAWIEFELSNKGIYYAKLDRSKKFPMTLLIKALGVRHKDILNVFGNNPILKETLDNDTVISVTDAIIELYSKLRQGEKVPLEGARDLISIRLFDPKRYDLGKVGRYKFNKKLDVLARAKNNILARDIIDENTGEVVFEAGTKITDEEIKYLDEHRYLLKKFIKLAEESAIENGKTDTIVEELYIKINDNEIKLMGNDQDEDKLYITISDIFAFINYYLYLGEGIGSFDDIDHLGNRRIRSAGELIKNQFRIGLTKLEKNIKDRMSTVELDVATPQTLINIKPLTSSLKEFFGSSQLSQFMDQINPLAEITQKRRISALGTGGLARDRAGVEVRDVHYSHYGRMCPIETPEGPSIGLITSLASYAKINEYGFIETPYLKVDKKTHCVTDTIEYMTADEEEEYVIASASTKLDFETGEILETKVIGRQYDETNFYDKEEIDYIDVSPKQIVSVATSCIPFLEHDEAIRALMGSNMQRQAIPLIYTDSPIVGTGIEYRAAKDSGSAVVSNVEGVVKYVDSKKVIIETEKDNKNSEKSLRFKKEMQEIKDNVELFEKTLEEKAIEKKFLEENYNSVNEELTQVTTSLNVFTSDYHNQILKLEEQITELLKEESLNEELDNSVKIKKIQLEIEDIENLINRIDDPKYLELKEEENKITAKLKKSKDSLKKLDKEIKSYKDEIKALQAKYKLLEERLEIESSNEVVFNLIQYERSNQDTCLLQRPIVKVGEKVEIGDVLADGPSINNGELALGKNVVVAFMTWNGYNYEDAVIMSERMVKDDVYTSIHIEKYEIEARDTKLGKEEITREVPNVSHEAVKNLDENGIIVPGAEVKEGDILVGKVTPKGQTDPTPEEKLLLAIFGEKSREVRDTSLKVPHGGGGIVHSVQHFKKSNGDELQPGVNEVIRVNIIQKRKISEGDKMAGRHGNKGVISKILPVEDMPFLEDGTPVDIMLNPLGVPSRMNLGQVLETHLGYAGLHLGTKIATPVFDGATQEDLRNIMIEDAIRYREEKIAKNKETINSIKSKIGYENNDLLNESLESLEEENKKLVKEINDVKEVNGEPNINSETAKIFDGKYTLYDGRTGEEFENRITVGVMYMIKLSHMVDDKIHARSVGPYTLVTQQPMGGKAQNGGQRLGEMEVWALMAYGASNILQEMLTVKSDDIIGRNKVFRAIVDGKPIPQGSIPESFRVLTKELQALGLYVELIGKDTGENEVNNSLVSQEDDDFDENYTLE